MSEVVVVGGGWAGCSAAISAVKAGASVTVLERTDMILGTGLVGGIMRNNGRFTSAEELIEMGAGELIKACDECSRHKNIDFPGHKHANLYDVVKMPGAVKKILDSYGVKVVYQCRISNVKMKGKTILAVEAQDGRVFEGDVFIDATGTAGPINNCAKYGNGCAMCILRCQTFGGRVSLAGLCGVEELKGKRADGNFGAMSGSCKLNKDSLSKEIRQKLDKYGVALVPIPQELVKTDLSKKACQQYALNEFAENIVLLDTGHAKMMSATFKLENLRQIPGFEDARFEDPYGGGVGNSMRYFAISPRDNALRVKGVTNLFCAGEKAGTLVGHNSVRYLAGMDMLIISESLAIGDAISFVQKQMSTEVGLSKKYTFSGSVYLERMIEKGLYTTDKKVIKERVKQIGLKDIFKKRLLSRNSIEEAKTLIG